MSITQAIITGAVCWWLLLLMALPIGVKTVKNPAQGHAVSAPERTNLRKKIKWVTVLSVLLTLLAYFLLNMGYDAS